MLIKAHCKSNFKRNEKLFNKIDSRNDENGVEAENDKFGDEEDKVI